MQVAVFDVILLQEGHIAAAIQIAGAYNVVHCSSLQLAKNITQIQLLCCVES